MLIIGLTGSIGMGKSTVAKILSGFGFPVYSADKASHDILKKGGAAVGPVSKLFPETFKRGAIDRKLLSRTVFGHPRKLKALEKIIHPRIRKTEKEFLKNARRKKARAAILEIPLLYEIKAESRCDIVLCVSAPKPVQKSRVLARPHMTLTKFRAIVARQLPDTEKCKRADYIVPTGTSIAETKAYLKELLLSLGLLP